MPKKRVRQMGRRVRHLSHYWKFQDQKFAEKILVATDCYNSWQNGTKNWSSNTVFWLVHGNLLALTRGKNVAGKWWRHIFPNGTSDYPARTYFEFTRISRKYHPWNSVQIIHKILTRLYVKQIHLSSNLKPGCYPLILNLYNRTSADNRKASLKIQNTG